MNEQAIEAKKTAVRKAIDELRPQLVNLAEKIHQNPESKFEEVKAFEGIVEQASEDELADAAARADRAGLYACPQTGVALATLTKLVSCGEIKKSERVVVISTAHGLKFTEMKVGYHEGTLAGVTPRRANPPLDLPADVAVVKERIARLLNHRVLS
jgi:threonine synthase